MTDCKNIHEAINAVMQDVGYVRKEHGKNLNYTFAGEAALIAALRPAMVENGIYMFVSKIANADRTEYTTKSGTAMQNTVIVGDVTFTHAPTETSIIVQSMGEGSDVGDKSANKALTGLFKYALRQTFMIETGDDPDKTGSEERASRNNGNGKKPYQLPKDDRPWSVAQKQALIDAELAKNDFAARGMLGLSVLPIEATPKEIVRWGEVYRKHREENDAKAAAMLANDEVMGKAV